MEKLIITVACDSRTSYPHNHLCPPQEDGLRNGQPERLGGLEVDDQLERSRSLHRQVTRLRAL